jgi:hypothetical protein
VVVVHVGLVSVCSVLYLMLVRCVIKPSAITPHALPSIAFP